MEKHHPEDQLEEELAPEEKQKDATPSVPAYDSPQGTKGRQQTADRGHADGLNANSLQVGVRLITRIHSLRALPLNPTPIPVDNWTHPVAGSRLLRNWCQGLLHVTDRCT